MDEYAITVRKTGTRQSDKSRAAYEPYFSFIRRSNKKCELHKYVFEDNKSESGVHLHGVIRIPKGYYRGRLIPSGGAYHVKLEKITDMEGWIRYMQKDQNFRENVFAISNLKSQCESDSEPDEQIDIDDDKPIMINLFKRRREV